MRRALEYATGLGVLIAQHAEEPRLTVGAVAHEGPNAARLGLAGWPRAAEESIVARDALLARDAGARVHICHASTAGTVEILRWAKAARHLDHRRGDPAPPAARRQPAGHLRRASTGSTRRCARPPTPQALRQALADGVIDCVATDHAPHAEHEKCCEFAVARPGHARPADRAVGGGRDDGATRAAGLARRRPGDEREPGPHRRSARPGPAAGGRRAGQPDGRRPGRDLDRRRRRAGQPLGQHAVRGDDAAGHGHR